LESNLLQTARHYAENAHYQHTYNGKPYITEHLDKVVQTLREHSINDQVILSIAYLHDVIEDTPLNKDDIQKVFGDVIATHVALLTDRPGKEREDRQMMTYIYLRDHPYALVVKLADRLTNMRASFDTKYALSYINEYKRFKTALYNPNYQNQNLMYPITVVHGMFDLWVSLDFTYQKLFEHFTLNSDRYINLAHKGIRPLHSDSNDEKISRQY
jgi:hypothetical protein